MTKTTSIKFFWNGIKINGEKTLIKCFYSLDNNRDNVPSVSISARDYGNGLPGDLFTVHNNTDLYTDYFDTDSAYLTADHPLYKYARAAAEKSEMRYLSREIERLSQLTIDPSRYNYDYYKNELSQKREKLDELQSHKDPGQPKPSDLAIVQEANHAAETARIEAEKAAEQARREEYLKERNEGRKYILEVAEQHMPKEGEPVVTIEWSENAALGACCENGPLPLSVAAAEIILTHFDKLNAAKENYGYDKTGFKILYTRNGETNTYEGRYDLGDDDGGMIEHIASFGRCLLEKGSHHNGNPSGEDKTAGAEILDFADYLKGFTAAGKVISVTFAPWFEKAVEKQRREREETAEYFNMALALLDTDDLKRLAIQHRKDRAISAFFLREIYRRDERLALEVFNEIKDDLQGAV